MAEAAKRSSSSDDGVTWNWDAKEIKSRWEAFTKFGSATATEMTGKNFDKWLKDAGVIDTKNITTTVTGIAFSKITGYTFVQLLIYIYI